MDSTEKLKERIMMDWTQVLAIMGANIGVMLPMFFWLRSEANADRRRSDDQMSETWHEIVVLRQDMNTEMRDFHGRLCAIEERNKGK
jgi:hypothetical protein